MASDAESDGFGAFDLSEFTPDDFVQIDTDIAGHFQLTATEDTEDAAAAAAANESFEFDASLDLFNLTEEDLIEIDSIVTLQLNTTSPTSPPSRVTVTPPAEPKPLWRYKGKKKAWDDKTLLEKYRPSGVLSVSDLVGPVWCEVQFDYGLRQRRSRPVDKRPQSFKTSAGKEIAVETKVAETNDVITKQGQAIHKELERELRVEEIKIDIKSNEERWGLRLLNMMACFQILMAEGLIREMPVFGMINHTVIVGIIDEICTVKQQLRGSLKPRGSHTSPYAVPQRQRTRSPSQTDIESFFPHNQSLAEVSPVENSGRYSLKISDTKTRVTDSMPAEADTLGSRLQVMLYRRLLSELISTNQPFNFTKLWDQLGIDPTVEFSTEFLVQSGLLVHNDGFPTTNLDGLTDAWKRTLEASSIANIDRTLQLVYRLQPGEANGTNGKGKETDNASPTAEAQTIARAIRNSLLEAKSRAEGQDPDEDADIDIELQEALYKSLASHVPEGTENAVDNSSVNESKPATEIDIHGYKIIGRKEFIYNSAMLDDHLTSIFDFWREERTPVGVPVELARRCNTCEYRTGCEWREEQATKFNRQVSGGEGMHAVGGK